MEKEAKPNAAKIAAEVIKEFEGYSSKPYLCPSNVPTIGYGNTRYANGERVTMEDKNITKKEAERLLLDVIRSVEKDVKSVVDVKLKPYQLAALISFTYNVGIGNFSKSTLLAKMNNCVDDQNLPDEFRRWNKSKGSVLNGLTRRRESEVELWEGTSQYV
tara:strand:+ start:150 stop:629 length:480 start_codon:yes stop_codon:yes gene_type:complete